MADAVANKRTSLANEEVITRAVQFFPTQNWRPSSQTARAATFDGRPPIPWLMMLMTVLGFMFCIVPGIICYVMLIKKARRFQNLVVTASPVQGGSDVTITHPSGAKKLAEKFLNSLPPLV